MLPYIGCPVGNKDKECVRGCGGWFQHFNREKMLQLLEEHRLDPEKMPCGPLKIQARRLVKETPMKYLRLTMDITRKDGKTEHYESTAMEDSPGVFKAEWPPIHAGVDEDIVLGIELSLKGETPYPQFAAINTMGEDKVDYTA